MKRLCVLSFIISLVLPVVAQMGSWRAYMSYYEPQQIVKAGSHDLFVRASNSLYQYNLNDHSITTFDKVHQLNDTYVQLIAWNTKAARLLIVYDNSNMDLTDLNGNVVNLSGLYNKLTTLNKTINSIYMYDAYAYLATGFGVVKVNMQRAEISESYILNQNIVSVGFADGTLYAQAADGTVYCGETTKNLINPNNWTVGTAPSDIFNVDNSAWNEYIETVRTLNPGGPKYNVFGFMRFYNDKLYTCNGDYDHSSGIQILKNNEWDIYQNEGISESTGVSYQGAFCMGIDPSDENHIFTGSRNGLYEFRNGKFVKYYDNGNSPIEPFDGVSKEYQLVTGTEFDKQGNLWILNSSAPTTALVKYTNGTFTKLSHSILMKLNRGTIQNRSNAELSKIIIDSKGLMWFVNNNWVLPALYQYNTENDNIIAYENIVNQDGTKINIQDGIRCVVEDLEQNIWVGTSMGPVMLERSEIENNGSTFTQVKVPRNDGTNYADYLLEGVNIKSIVVDGGNRKWIGTTGNGLYLISADNMEQIEHFTADNSPLLSNNIFSLAINNETGELYIGTDIGLCSYTTDATAALSSIEKDNVYAYPNPVEPGYDGLITIVGLSLDADVKILSASGQLVAQGRSNGGTFTWNGRDKKGRRVVSGIYMVATATNKGEKGTVCKIAIIR